MYLISYNVRFYVSDISRIIENRRERKKAFSMGDFEMIFSVWNCINLQ